MYCLRAGSSQSREELKRLCACYSGAAALISRSIASNSSSMAARSSYETGASALSSPMLRDDRVGRGFDVLEKNDRTDDERCDNTEPD